MDSQIAPAGFDDRSSLFAILDQWWTALRTGDVQAARLASDVRITENGQGVAPGQGLWACCTGRAQIAYQFADTQTGQVGLIGVVDEGGGPAIVAARLQTRSGLVTEVELIVARGGEMLFEPETVLKIRPQMADPLRPDERRPRAEMARAAELYFEGLEAATGRDLRISDGCGRYENGYLATNNPERGPMFQLSCRAQFDTGFSTIISEIRGRRVVMIDEAGGFVFSIIFFEHNGDETELRLADGSVHAMDPYYARPMAYLIGELFKIGDGEIREIEAVLLTTPFGMQSGWE